MPRRLRQLSMLRMLWSLVSAEILHAAVRSFVAKNASQDDTPYLFPNTSRNRACPLRLTGNCFPLAVTTT